MSSPVRWMSSRKGAVSWLPERRWQRRRAAAASGRAAAGPSWPPRAAPAAGARTLRALRVRKPSRTGLAGTPPGACGVSTSGAKRRVDAEEAIHRPGWLPARSCLMSSNSSTWICSRGKVSKYRSSWPWYRLTCIHRESGRAQAAPRRSAPAPGRTAGPAGADTSDSPSRPDPPDGAGWQTMRAPGSSCRIRPGAWGDSR